MHKPTHRFTPSESYRIYSQVDNEINFNHPLVNFSPSNDFMAKGLSDEIMVLLWNEIMGKMFEISDISNIKSAASDTIKYLDENYPNGSGMSESEYIQYITAFSVSSFIGIQRPSKSKISLDSMVSTLISHSEGKSLSKPWLLDNLKSVFDYVNRHSLMNRNYSDVCLSAKSSSASIPGFKNFRDFVFTNSLDDVVADLRNVPLFIYAGVRMDRRGKYRLICSFDGRFRVIDYLLNNGLYSLCEHGGYLSKYTTEGYSVSQMYPELAKMSYRGGDTILVCLDYKGYDTQISLIEYRDLCMNLNRYRMHDDFYGDILSWYFDWLTQPKPLLTRGDGQLEILLPLYHTLASGLHGTHSKENLIGISTKIEAENRGIPIHLFKSNGDDQNTMIRRSDLEGYMDFINSYFNVSWEKSLVGHSLGVWGKLWFASDFHPFWEIGTLRSIWEREGGEINYVESSKFQSNYCKILQIIITMIRLGKRDSTIQYWTNLLCSQCGIRSDVIPITLNNLHITTTSTNRFIEHPGLDSAKHDLDKMVFKMKSLNVDSYYSMLSNMYTNNTFYSLDIYDAEYYPSGTMFHIEAGVRYSDMVPNDVPWLYRHLYSGVEYSLTSMFNRDVLQGTKSYDGSSTHSYPYRDMISLARAINDRNLSVWRSMVL